MWGLLTWLLPALALLVGVVMIWQGVRGRVVNDHPVCRNCGRDLFGLPPLLERCPDCGRELQPGDVSRGTRERRTGLITVGAFIATPAALWLAGAGALAFSGDSALRYKPVFLLSLEMDGDSADKAAEELSRRMMSRDLSPEQINGLASRFLEHQANPNRTWKPEKGDFIERCFAGGAISPAMWEQYIEQGVGPAIEARPVVSAGAALPVHVLPAKLRLGSYMAMFSGMGGRAEGLPITLLLYGRTAEGESFVAGRGEIDVGASSGSREPADIDVTAAQRALAGGKEEAELTLALASTDEPKAPPLETRRWTMPVKLVARPEQSVKIRNDGEVVSAVQEAVSVLSLEVDPPEWWRRVLSNNMHERYDPPQTYEARLTIRMVGNAALPPSCYEIFVDDGSQEHRVTTVVRERGFKLTIPFTMKNFDAARIDKVTVLLRPDAEVAEQTVDMLEICGGEIVVEDVPVTYPEWYPPHRPKLAAQAPATRPAPQED